MVAHARATYPNECCGAMMGSDGRRAEARARWPCRWKTRTAGPQGERYELRPEDLLEADREARAARWTWSASFIRIPTATRTSPRRI